MNLTQAELNAALDKSCSMTSQKGGVAKTTTTAQYAKFLANVGMKVLVVDADTNRSMTVLTGTGPTAENPVSIADLIKYPTEPSIIARAAHLATEPWQPDTTRSWKLGGGALVPGGSVHVVPSPGAPLQQIADEKPAAAHLRLWKGLHESGLSADYDIVLIDCPPSVGSTTELAILASGWAIFPAHPELLGTVGFADGVRAVQHFAEAWRHPLAVAGVVVTKVNRTTEHRVGVEGTVQFVSGTWPDSGFEADDPRDAFASGVWAPAINEAAFVAAANGRGESVADALPRCSPQRGSRRSTPTRSCAWCRLTCGTRSTFSRCSHRSGTRTRSRSSRRNSSLTSCVRSCSRTRSSSPSSPTTKTTMCRPQTPVEIRVRRSP